tara:strand:+ start:46 stop:291 length:246 start_codon:yes stop_codon:yes gene_type:complete
MSKKLTTEELENLQKLSSEINQSKLKLADLVYQQSFFIKQINSFMEKFKLIENELVEKYGDNSSINLANGEVVSNENKEIE